MAFAGVEGTIGGTDDVIFGYLVEQPKQHGRITRVVGRDVHGPNFQCFFVDAYVYLAPDASFGTTMLAGIHPQP